MPLWRQFVCLCAFLVSLAVHALPEPATGGAGGSPIDLLFLRGNSEIGFGEPVPLDAGLVTKLEAQGFRVHVARDFSPLTREYLRQFEVVIWLGVSPAYAESRLYSPVGWQGGMHMLTVQRNAELLQEYVREGGGLLLNPGLEELGMQIVPSHNRVLAPYGLATQCAQVRDTAHQEVFYKVLNRYPYYLSWTERIAEHPATAGVERVWYPAYTMRWDDNLTTLPLYPQDEAWTTLVQAEPTAAVSWYRGTPFEDGHWKDDPEARTPAIAAVRNFGKGRVGAIGIGHFHLFYYPYSNAKNHREITFGPQNGVLMETGMGERPSQLGLLLDNLYRWLAEPAAAAGIGTFDPAATIAEPPMVAPPVENRAAVWALDDPLVADKSQVRPRRILVGARTAYSDGEGSVADYAAAAKAAGYDVVAFTETFEHLTDAEYRQFVRECAELSDEQVYLLPGLDVADSYGNRFLLLGKDTPIRHHLLVEKEADAPGKVLIWTGHMLIGMGEVLPVAARPAWLATEREHGALPPDLVSHCPGVAVATYRDGRLVDDGKAAYRWQLFNASVPVPVAVHEVYRPADVALAAKTGLQTIVNGDTPANVANYLRQGHMSFGGNPMRTYVSSGPTAVRYAIDDWQADPWTVTLSLRSEAPIASVVVDDQQGLYRRFLPNAAETTLAWHGDQGRQHWFHVEVTDANGGQAIFSPLRTLPGARAFVRCMDRQNWFSGLHFTTGVTYTGRLRNLPMNTRPALGVPDVKLAGDWAPKLQLTYNGPGLTVVDYRLDATVESLGRPLGADASPIFNCRPVPEFEANLRYLFTMPLNRGGRPQATVLEASITLKQELTPQGEVWPVLFRTTAKEAAALLPEGATQAELPTGTKVAGGTLLDPLWLTPDGALGPKAPATGEAGTRFAARLALSGTAPAETASSDPNPRWPLIAWTADGDALQPYGYLDGIARGHVPEAVSYYGSAIVADDPRLALSFVEPWTAEKAVIAVHNPTDEAITTTVRTAPAITTRHQLSETVTVPPGTTVILGR